VAGRHLAGCGDPGVTRRHLAGCGDHEPGIGAGGKRAAAHRPPGTANLTVHQILRQAASGWQSARRAAGAGELRRGFASRLACLIALLAAPAGASPPGRASAPGEELAPILDQADLFSDRAIRTFALELPEGRWRRLRERALDERYAAARLRVEGVPVGVVGVRFKGAAGTLASCFRDGRPICPKLPIKLRFDLYAPGRRFFGLERLNLHAMQHDRSLLRERLAYRVFEDAGVVAPRTAWARLVVNGEPLGLFAVVEPIDGRFTDRRFFFDDGLLYKEAWPATTDAAYYEERLQTRRSQPHDHRKMIGFARELAQAPPDELAGVLARWTDLDYLMRYMAADRLVGNWDGITAWYCDRGPCTNHNFYWYAEAGRRRLWLLPWDLDDAFRLFDPLFPARDWLAGPAACDERPLAWGKRPLRHPGCDRLVAALAAVGRERFREALREVLERAFDLRRLRAQVLAWRELLAPHVARDPHGPSPAVWEAEVESLLASLERLRARGEALAREGWLEPFGLDLARRNDFEAATPASVWRSVDATGNARTRLAHGLGLRHALAGRADLRLDFELRNDSRAAADRLLQWARLRVPFAGGTADLSRVGSIRLHLRADSPRTVRVDLESPRYGSDDPGLRYGWDVAASRAPRALTLEVSELALPVWSTAAPAPLAEVLAHATALSFNPQPKRRSASGFLPDGSDPGFLRVDDIEFVGADPRAPVALRGPPGPPRREAAGRARPSAGSAAPLRSRVPGWRAARARGRARPRGDGCPRRSARGARPGAPRRRAHADRAGGRRARRFRASSRPGARVREEVRDAPLVGHAAGEKRFTTRASGGRRPHARISVPARPASTAAASPSAPTCAERPPAPTKRRAASSLGPMLPGSNAAGSSSAARARRIGRRAGSGQSA
jgi:hypothetical protein